MTMGRRSVNDLWKQRGSNAIVLGSYDEKKSVKGTIYSEIVWNLDDKLPGCDICSKQK
jgi:hypothetical protein